MDRRARARELAEEYLNRGDPKGWFEHLYREAEEGNATVPWADCRPNPGLLAFWERQTISSVGKTALTIGCGFGDDAEQLAAWGFQTTAFDVSESAIRSCRQRFPDSKVDYTTADLLRPPDDWIGLFDFVLEAYTLQVLPTYLREQAMQCISSLVRNGGQLLVIARGRDEQDPISQMPWPVTRCELDTFKHFGFEEISFEDYFDLESPPVRRFRGVYKKVSLGCL